MTWHKQNLRRFPPRAGSFSPTKPVLVRSLRPRTRADRRLRRSFCRVGLASRTVRRASTLSSSYAASKIRAVVRGKSLTSAMSKLHRQCCKHTLKLHLNGFRASRSMSTSHKALRLLPWPTPPSFSVTQTLNTWALLFPPFSISKCRRATKKTANAGDAETDIQTFQWHDIFCASRQVLKWASRALNFTLLNVLQSLGNKF